MKHGPCATCLWWWDLYDTGERRCYRNVSKFYHQLTVDGCTKHEDSMTKMAAKWNKVTFGAYMAKRKEKKH